MKFVELVDNRFITAVTNISSHVIRRIFWALIGTVCLVVTVWMSFLLLSDYFNYPSYTLIQTSYSDHYYLPAITICNVNFLNRTKMESVVISDKLNTYQVYQELVDQFGVRQKGRAINGHLEDQYIKINNQNVYAIYRWDILSTMPLDLIQWAKGKLSDILTEEDATEVVKETLTTAFTEMGNCLEINDNQVLVQRVNGPVGGLNLVLDAQVKHYLDSTESEGFYISLRMPHETVLKKEYSFLVAPGTESYIQLSTSEVERLEHPWGTCKNLENLYNVDQKKYLSWKECFATKVAWYYLYEPACRCYPWYFYTRYFGDPDINRRNQSDEVRNRLQSFWSEDGLFTEPCLNMSSTDLMYSGVDAMETVTKVTSPVACMELCNSTNGCEVFQFTINTTDAGANSKDCELFGAETEVVSNTRGYALRRGSLTCQVIREDCKLTQQMSCENSVIASVGEESLQRKRVSKSEECYEPCNYNRTTFQISSSTFPSEKYWSSKLNKYFPHYSNLYEARQNLVKLHFYQDTLHKTSEVQTRAYEIQNLIAEFGGLTDLLVGISFFTLFAIMDWILVRLCSGCRRGSKDQVIENNEPEKSKTDAV